MTVKENFGWVVLSCGMAGWSIKELKKYSPCSQFLKEKSSQMARTLSGGQQQLAAIARALVLKPEMIMLDEPSLGLSPKVVQQIFSTITELRKNGMTILLVEQNARKGLQIADQGLCWISARIVLKSPLRKFLSDPRIQELYLGKRRKSLETEEQK